MSKAKKDSSSRSWRDINQSVNQRAMTAQGRRRFRRNVMRAILSIVTCGGVAVLAFFVYEDYQSPESPFAAVAEQTPLRDIVVLTDGTLTEAWAEKQLALPDGIPLMTIDLEAAKLALEAEGQVRAAVVTRHFPSTLLVTLEERAPIARMMVAVDPARPEPMFVARDGAVYRGFFYDRDLEARLPWLAPNRLVRDRDGFAPIAGLENVAELLLAAIQDAPHLVDSFHIISLAESPQIVVEISEGPQAVFSPGDFRLQLARLDYVLDLCRQQPLPHGTPGRIDLSLGTQVVVQLAGPGADSHDASVATTFTHNSTNQQENRDF